jgi:hypothetical protein
LTNYNLPSFAFEDGLFYAILFAYSHTLGIQEEMIQRSEWKRFFTEDKLQTPIEEVDVNMLKNSNEKSSEQVTDPRQVGLEKFQEIYGSKLATSPFAFSSQPVPENLQSYWHALSIKGGWGEDKVTVTYNEYDHRYEHADDMLKANSSLCHHVAFLPKELHEQFLLEYREHMHNEYCRKQPSYPVVFMKCDFIQLVAQK